MSQYATAIQDAAQEREHYGPSGHDIRQPVQVHAVQWPGPHGDEWGEARTMCGRPTTGMEQTAHTAPDPTTWHAPRWEHLRCDACDEAVRAAAGVSTAG